MGQRVNESLNEEGVKQAKDLARNLDKDFDLIFTSPLKRAVETAKLISEQIGASIIERAELMERDFGSLSGKGWEEMPDDGEYKKNDFEQKYDYRPFGGESAEDVKNRLIKFMDELKKEYSDKKVLIVAHGGILKMAHFMFSEEHLKMTPNNASLHEFNI